jgi:hypothetical protein
MGESCSAKLLELFEARPVHTGPALPRPTNLGGRIYVDHVLDIRPIKERVKDGNDVRPRCCAHAFPPLEEGAKICRRQLVELGLGIVLSELPENPPV